MSRAVSKVKENYILVHLRCNDDDVKIGRNETFFSVFFLPLTQGL